MLSKKRNGWLWVVMLFAVCAVVYGMLSSYPRELAVYSDELRYLMWRAAFCRGADCGCAICPATTRKFYTRSASCRRCC